MNFYITFAPGTVRYLRLFTLSLLKWSDCTFTLVENGCPKIEIAQIRRFCESDSRLSFLPTHFNGSSHGKALTELHQQHQSGVFAFLDSDIFATGEFFADLEKSLAENVGVFSGRPVWCGMDDQILHPDETEISGRHTQTESGIYLATTYCALYNNKILSELRKESSLTFEKYSWDAIPSEYQKQIAEMGLKKEFYDTGKVLNLALLSHNHKFAFVEPPELHHLGGISGQFLRYDKEQVIDQGENKWWHKIAQRRNPDSAPPSQPKIKKPAANYIALLICSLFDDTPAPVFPTNLSDEVQNNTRELAHTITSLYREFEPLLAA